MLANKGKVTATLAAIEVASQCARPVLELEWERVKDGGLAFRVARNWLAPFLIASLVALGMSIWSGSFMI